MKFRLPLITFVAFSVFSLLYGMQIPLEGYFPGHEPKKETPIQPILPQERRGVEVPLEGFFGPKPPITMEKSFAPWENVGDVGKSVSGLSLKEALRQELSNKLGGIDVEAILQNLSPLSGSTVAPGPKVYILFVHGEETKPNSAFDVLRILAGVGQDLVSKIPTTSLTQAKVTVNTFGMQFEYLAYRHQNNPDRLARLIEVLNKQDNKLIIFAEGDSAKKVNTATRLVSSNKNIHALIYFQSSEAEQPKMFNRLYNFYTEKPAGYFAKVEERQYRQQVRMVGEIPVMPVKNISVLRNLSFMPANEFIATDFLKRIPTMVMNIEQYSLNFDLFTNIQGNNNAPVAISRFIKIGAQTNSVSALHGAGGGSYSLFDIPIFKRELFEYISKEFTRDFNTSENQLREMLLSGGPKEGMIEYFNRIGTEYKNIGSNRLFNKSYTGR